MTRTDKITGIAKGNLQIYRGITYAKLPVGKPRWQASEAIDPWINSLNAEKFGAACVQKVAAQEPEKSLKDWPQSEDCLTLNIWAPSAPSETRSSLPVMVWVHGGSFRFGAGNLPAYDGSALARRGVVVITINYRLGLFGTFAHPELMASDQSAGNFGLLDVMQVLRWVKENASAFGGDPTNVTLFGESAGGATVAYLMTSPMAKGLFSKAIIQSGASRLLELSPAKATEIAAKVSKELNATSLEELKLLSDKAIRDAHTGLEDTQPFIDGRIMPQKMQQAFASGAFMQIPMIIGSNDFEAGFFGPAFWKEIPEQLGKNWSDIRSACFSYGAHNDEACAAQVASERFAGITPRTIARAASRCAPVYLYRFGWVSPRERGTTWGASHTAEIPYVLGHVKSDEVDPDSVRLSATLADRWVAFAKTGSPNLDHIDSVEWERLTAGESEDKHFLINDVQGHMAPNPAERLQDILIHTDTKN